MTQYGFFFDQSRCYGCKACSVACKDWYDIAPGPEKWMSVYMWEKGRFPNPSIGILAFNCGHCDNPVCAATCENGAIFKEDKYGAVLVDQDKCKGDRHCFEACPYGAPKFASDEPGTKMSKCTMCIDRLENDQLPLCVASCQPAIWMPTGRPRRVRRQCWRPCVTVDTFTAAAFTMETTRHSCSTSGGQKICLPNPHRC